MDRGFYTLGSGLLTQSRVLGVISNNVANADTNGYKKVRQTQQTFGSMVVERVRAGKTPIGTATLMSAPGDAVTDYSQGTVTGTGRNLDFAIRGDGFFAVQGQGGVVYTRNGSFNLDDEGYLVLKGQGRVLGGGGEPIRPGTDDLAADSQGVLTAQGQVVGQLAVYRFPDNAALEDAGEGVYRGNGAVLEAAPDIRWKSIEGSNVDMTVELTSALSSERQLQTCSNALNLYDQTLDKAVDISKL